MERVLVVGLDRRPSPWTAVVASPTDRDALRAALRGVTHVLHTATLHKPHVGSHSRQDLVDTNVSGTLAVLEESAAAGVRWSSSATSSAGPRSGTSTPSSRGCVTAGRRAARWPTPSERRGATIPRPGCTPGDFTSPDRVTVGRKG